MKTRSLYTVWVLSVLLSLTACNGAGDEPDVSREYPSSRSGEERPPADAAEQAPVVLFLGNSLAAGYGVQPEQSFPSLIQDRIDEAGWGYEVVNAGVSGDTSSGGLSRINWLLDHNVAVLVLELGGNDGLRGIPPEVTQKNLQDIINRTRERHPDARILLAGMQIPPNMGSGYAQRFSEIYTDLDRRNDDVDLIPFLLEGVGGVRALNQPDGIHPTPRGHEIIAENVWEHLRPILQDIRQEQPV